MHAVDTYDAENLYEEIEYGSRPDKAEAYEEAGRSVPAGEHGHVLFLMGAAEHWVLRGEIERARSLLAEIADAPHDPGEGILGVRAIQLSIALKEGDAAEAETLLRQLLVDFRADEVTTATCHYVGESLQEAGEPKKALRWFTLPLSNVDPDEDLDTLEEMCVEARAAVRRELGLPKDRFDAVADELAALTEG